MSVRNHRDTQTGWDTNTTHPPTCLCLGQGHQNSNARRGQHSHQGMFAMEKKIMRWWISSYKKCLLKCSLNISLFSLEKNENCCLRFGISLGKGQYVLQSFSGCAWTLNRQCWRNLKPSCWKPTRTSKHWNRTPLSWRSSNICWKKPRTSLRWEASWLFWKSCGRFLKILALSFGVCCF